MKEIEMAIKKAINEAEKNLERAIGRQDYSAAARAESYLAGLSVALGIVQVKTEEVVK